MHTTSHAANHDKIRRMIVDVLDRAQTHTDVERWVAERVDVDGRLYVIQALRHAFGSACSMSG